MNRRALVALTLMSSLAACGDDGTGGDASMDTSVDSSEDSTPNSDFDPNGECTQPVADETCPEEQPLDDTPCIGELSCPYAQGRGGSWTAACAEGVWDNTAESAIPGGGLAPPLAEICRGPFDGQAPGGAIELGVTIDGEFVPFAEQQDVLPVVGGQGAAMIGFEVRLAGANALTCVTLSATSVMTTANGGSDIVSEQALNTKVNCGASRTYLLILNGYQACGPLDEKADVELTVDVAGVGSSTINIKLPNLAPACLDG